MKSIALSLVFLFSTQSMASEFFTDADKILSKYSLCTPQDSEQISAEKQFKLMYATLKISEQQGKSSNIEVTDFSMSSLSLMNTSTTTECTMLIDGYDGRCYNLICN